MQTVSTIEIERWIAENHCYKDSRIHLRQFGCNRASARGAMGNGAMGNGAVSRGAMGRGAVVNRSSGYAKRKPWYQRQPQNWFKPLFAALLFVRERWQAFAFIALLAVVFGLCWWAVSLWVI